MNIDKLSKLSFWTDWQNKVVETLPNFGADCIFVHQTMDRAFFEEEAKRVASQKVIYDPEGKEKDVAIGAGSFLVDTQACGRVSRMWLDTNREINFLSEHFDLKDLEVLDIGAGYGRLAVVLSKLVRGYSTVDSVEISASACRHYCKTNNAPVNVMNLTDMLVAHKAGTLPKFNIAFNIHSWSECDENTVRAWFDTLRELQVPHLFTVLHTHDYVDYAARRDLRPLFNQYYTHVAHRADGIINSPYDLWRLKA